MLKLCSKQQFSLEKFAFSDKQKARIPYSKALKNFSDILSGEFFSVFGIYVFDTVVLKVKNSI